MSDIEFVFPIAEVADHSFKFYVDVLILFQIVEFEIFCLIIFDSLIGYFILLQFWILEPLTLLSYVFL